MSHILGGSKPAQVVVEPTPTVNQVLQPTLQPSSGTAPGKGTGTPSFLGSAVIPPSAQGGTPSNQKKLLGT